MKRVCADCVLLLSLLLALGPTSAIAQEPVESVGTAALAAEADPQYQQTHAILSTPWLDSRRSQGIAYFLFQSPAELKRYDLNAETWLPNITLGDTPTAFAVDSDGLYISFGRRTSRLDLEGTEETHLRNSNSDVTSLFTVGDFLYIYSPKTLMSVNKWSGVLLDWEEYWYEMQGICVAPEKRRAYARTSGVGPADIVEVVLNTDGTLGAQNDSPYHGDYPEAVKTFLFPGEAFVADDSGIVYRTNGLTYGGSLAGAFDDMAFHNDSPIVLRNSTLVAYSAALLETGQYRPAAAPQKIYVKGEFVFAFRGLTPGIEVAKIPLSALQPIEPGPPVNPYDTPYTPDAVELGKNEIVYLLSREHRSVFRWSVPDLQYLDTIALLGTPIVMAYSQETNRLYLAYTSGKITEIRVDEPLQEKPFVNSPQWPCGLSTAGQYVFVCDPSGAWVSHFTYSPSGQLLSQQPWNYRSDEYVWSLANRKMYFLRDDTSPNDLLWENVGVNGVLGTKQDSPYHDSTGIEHPVRVDPSGSVVLLGSGRLYNAISLYQVDTLSNNVVDGVWWSSTLFTMRPYDGGTQLQRWGSNYGVEATRMIYEQPIRLFLTARGLLAITNSLGETHFTLWDFDLKQVYNPRAYIPLAIRQAAPPPPPPWWE